jgi:hypothetical protein
MIMFKRRYLTFTSLLFTTICPVANAQAQPEHHADGQAPLNAAAHRATSYQLNRQKLVGRLEVLAKKGAGIAEYKAALEAIDKKSLDGVDEKQLAVELEKLAQDVTEQEQNLAHIKELEAHPPQLPPENGNGFASSRSPSQQEVERAKAKIAEGEQAAQSIRDSAEREIKAIQKEEHDAGYTMGRRGLGLVALPADEAADAREPYEGRIRSIRERSESQANDVLLEYMRQAKAICPIPE